MNGMAKLNNQSSLLERLFNLHQYLKYASRFEESDPRFFIALSNIFADPTLPIDFSDCIEYQPTNTRRSRLKEWVTKQINQTFILIIKKILADPDKSAVLYWEMGNFFDPSKEQNEEDMNKKRLWAIDKIKKDQLGPNKSLISMNVLVQGRKLYFCIPLPLLEKEVAIKALEIAQPIPSHNHSRKPEKIQKIYHTDVPINQRLVSA
ncbi:MAG: hypothetical protein ACRCXZ_04280 [Patescibacteria group bacterium]